MGADLGKRCCTLKDESEDVLSAKLSREDHRDLQEIFRALDAEKKERINVHQVIQWFQLHNVDIDQGKLQNMLEVWRPGHDGIVGFGEFVHIMKEVKRGSLLPDLPSFQEEDREQTEEDGGENCGKKDLLSNVLG